ncbi:hypothetical protein C6A86_006070 [Mycobacterium sp. ITM-2016-00316]|uniref:hypothetical protein n=1 Tax=Mycobacterium sp. ITM-2016-00316 TaxID=2099695 RepID=UPI001304D592|nr:hypothetical protein [Mycobacterium sp. ITM-2016-00316]WNG84794.1 hypothetical protein C6A86_006070 [Mycobacterium sp. ITM-2016-00316]
MAHYRCVPAFPPLREMTRHEVVEWIGPTLQRCLTGYFRAARSPRPAARPSGPPTDGPPPAPRHG